MRKANKETNKQRLCPEGLPVELALSANRIQKEEHYFDVANLVSGEM
jgi:hypothetical protein